MRVSTNPVSSHGLRADRRHSQASLICSFVDASADSRTVRRARTRKNKEVNLERLKELSEQHRAQLHVPFHSLRPEEDAPQTVLEKADHDLVEYCSALPGDERAERCWQAVRYFEERKAEAEAGCVLPDGSRGGSEEACSGLEHLEAFVRQFVGQAPTHMFVQTLLVLDAADRHAEERKNKPIDDAPRELDELEVQRRRLADLFYAMDGDLNGMLDVEEFRQAMKKAKHELSGPVVSKVLDAMDIHGRLTLDQFLAIAEAEEIYANTPLAAWLRRSNSTS